MKHYLYPRALHALQRACRTLVSSDRACSLTRFFSSQWSPHCGPWPLYPARELAEQTYRRIFVERPYPIRPIQSA
jgi:hypothetical protein